MAPVRSAQVRNPDLLRALVGRGPGRRMTGTALSEKAGVSRSFISQLLSGTHTTCTPRVAGQIAVALGVNIDTLFEPIMSTTRHRGAAQQVAR